MIARDLVMADAHGDALPTIEAGEPRPGASTPDMRARRAQFEAEALAHLDALYSFALKLTRSRDEAEDLVSETMLRALERWEQYQLGTVLGSLRSSITCS
jgi:RNA polymerase sigma-70 factor (ECF subfamily)